MYHDEIVVIASCPEIHHDKVAEVCRMLKFGKAFGRAGDMVNTLAGGADQWIPKWQAKVVATVAAKVEERDASRAKIICISGGPQCDKEVSAQPLLVRAIKTELCMPDFKVKVEWMEYADFVQAYCPDMALSWRATTGSRAATTVSRAAPTVSRAAIEPYDALMRKVWSSMDTLETETRLQWGYKSLTDSDCESIAHLGATGALAQVETLQLFHNQIGDAGFTALADAFARGAMRRLRHLSIEHNQIGDAGVTALANACAGGTLEQLEGLVLHSNQIGDAGLTALAKACAGDFPRALAGLKYLDLQRNHIGDAGVTALAKACASEALEHLEYLHLEGNPIGDPGVTALATTLSKGRKRGALKWFKKLTLSRNSISNKAGGMMMKAFEDYGGELVW